MSFSLASVSDTPSAEISAYLKEWVCQSIISSRIDFELLSRIGSGLSMLCMLGDGRF